MNDAAIVPMIVTGRIFQIILKRLNLKLRVADKTV
jgi:hypothetical protein